MSSNQLIKIAKITSPHGVKGEVKLFLYTENLATQSYPRYYLEENEVKISFRGFKGKTSIANIENITDRNQALEIKNQYLYINHDDLEDIKDPNAFYIDDLIDCLVLDQEDRDFGQIIDIQNHGAGDILAIELNNGKTELYPFIKEIFPDIDLDKKQVKFIKPEVV